VEGQRVGADLDAHKIAVRFLVGVVARFENPALVFGDETRDAGDDADAIGAGKEKGIKALAVHDVLAGSVDLGAGKVVSYEATVLGCLRLNPRIISFANPVRQPLSS
jgi:hypothetical protein